MLGFSHACAKPQCALTGAGVVGVWGPREAARERRTVRGEGGLLSDGFGQVTPSGRSGISCISARSYSRLRSRYDINALVYSCLCSAVADALFLSP